MKIVKKPSITHVGAIEPQYGVKFNVRSNMHLGTLLNQRGFNSMTALIQAYKGNRAIPKCGRPVFLSFYHAHNRKKGWVSWLSKELGYKVVPNEKIQSSNEEYIRETLKNRIAQCSVLICLIGFGAHKRSWIRWEIEEAIRLGCGICAVRLLNQPDALGRKARPAKIPALIEEYNFPIVEYPEKPEKRKELIKTIERAAAIGCPKLKPYKQFNKKTKKVQFARV